MLHIGMGQSMRHMVWQDQETFDQGCDQNHNHSERNIDDQITKAPAHSRQSKKGDNRGQGGRKHRHRHATGSVFSGNNWVLFVTADTVIGMLAHYNGVINNDPKCDDQPEQRHHIDGDPKGIHQGKGRGHGHRNTGSDPKGRARVQEQE